MTHTQQLVIVRRNQFATFALFAQGFADEPNVRLVWDRRIRQRRHASATPEGQDRRSRDRRGDPSLTWGTNDYLLLTLSEPPAPAASPSNAGVAHEAQVAAAPSRLIGEMGRDIDAAARSDLSVLISGGDAVSRKSLAHQIHRCSDRCTRAFAVVDREAFVELFVAKDRRDQSRANESKGGTVLIEEIAQWSRQQQSELLWFLERISLQRTPESGPEVRLISGTDHCLLDRVASGEFRADLFYRLNAIHLVLPAGGAPVSQ